MLYNYDIRVTPHFFTFILNHLLSDIKRLFVVCKRLKQDTENFSHAAIYLEFTLSTMQIYKIIY